MIKSRRFVCVVITALMPFFLSVVTSTGAEPELLDTTSSTVFDAGKERLLEVSDLVGEVSVRPGKEHELKFMAVEMQDHARKVPLEFWKDGQTLRLIPAADVTVDGILLEMSVPSNLQVKLDLSSSNVIVSSLGNALEIVGEDLDIDIRSLRESLTIDIENSKMLVRGVAGFVSMVCRDVEGHVAGAGGDLIGNFTGGKINLRGISGETEIKADRTRLVVEDVDGFLNWDTRDGSGRISSITRGGRLLMHGTPVELMESRGDLRIDSDADLSFHGNVSNIHIKGYGGSITGQDVQGLVEINTESASITVKTVEGPMRILGERLVVGLSGVTGEIGVYADLSEIRIEEAGGAIEVESEFSDITIVNAEESVSIDNQDGTVVVSGQRGSLDIHNEGPEVRVGWRSLQMTADSVISNLGGIITLDLPLVSSGGCMLEAHSSTGRIHSEIDTVHVGDDMKSASGEINGSSASTVLVEARDDITIKGTVAVESQPQPDQ